MRTLPIIKSSKLSEYPDVVAGVSTRVGGISPEPYGLNLSFHVGDERGNVVENRRRFLESLGIWSEEIAVPNQCHTSTVRIARWPSVYEKCDALVTAERRVFLVVTVADCIPVLMYDRKNKVVAAVHVGWRGAASDIVQSALDSLRREFLTDFHDLIVFLGPSARSCCYDVGEDVASRFPGDFLRPSKNGKWFLDLQGFTKAQLAQFDLLPDQIEEDGRCTICRPDLFNSFRREGKRSGRMMGVIGLL